MTSTVQETPGKFSPYQKIVVTILAFLQFAVIVDFMLMSPLGAMIIPELEIDTAQFGLVVSAYAFSAGIAGLLTAGLADRYDRKKLLLFFYTGFLLGTLWCGLASSYEMLLLARIVTGLFGGVIGSIVLAIATDLFPPHMRGRVMGLIQTAFAASQVLGIPIGLYLANRWDWHMPFLAMAGFGLVGGLLMLRKMQPVNAHLALPQEHSPWMHLYHTVTERRYLLAFAITAVLTTGGFMLMPFSSAYIVNNLGIDMHQLPTVYLVTGVCTIFFGPLIGKAADAYGKFRVFTFGTVVSIVMVLVYTRLDAISLPALIIINALMFVGIFSRMIPYQALVSSVPAANQRGSFNAISASIQQLAGGVASVIAGHIVTFGADGKLQHFDLIGDVMVGTALLALALLWVLQRNTARVPVTK
ncbi:MULTISPECIES: MFS transporter [unclassified Janthinobacterium]|uniref:MFS transporter n=1 Tax=unclassified Janthinobacterium TaxID=2610881 RepID=UPI00160EA4D9|nr:MULTISPECIES: MFS transporter [unclassified Janthinobacterium]MBB5371685.1 putative MFS family arabinose efflux permease [Janthinobacterium sp. K2C7]MBB5384490.1 putative MFS family arabinose efflux permease [Janthinobacterium sp. K2Li3]MBB5389766.1 putative MFS family arabinose efflux permease [Janthinobacterium sp. K2E3]